MYTAYGEAKCRGSYDLTDSRKTTMLSTPVFIHAPAKDATAKFRPVTLPFFDIYALGITHLNGKPIQQFVTIPPTEPGVYFEIVEGQGKAVLIEMDPNTSSLLPGLVILICDTAGSEGEVAMVSFVEHLS